MANLIFKTIAIAGFSVFCRSAQAQDPLEGYIRIALDSNQVLQQKAIKYEQALLVLKTAKSNFLPSVNFNASYLSAQGGRYASLPIGDMLNPVYATLNQMTGSSSFPQIENQQINFLPNNYYDAYVRTAMPIFNADIRYNKQIQEQKAEISAFESQIYARELVKDIKVAYYNYCSALKLVEVYESNVKLLEKNIALNEALIAQGKGLKVNLLRSQSELMKLEASVFSAKNQVKNAAAYFNFLLNRSSDSPIDLGIVGKNEPQTIAMGQQREELKMLQHVSKAQSLVLEMNQKFWYPKLNAFVDLGSQATGWEVSNKSAYYMVGVSTSIPIYNGTKNKQQIKQSQLELEHTSLELSNLEKSLNLAVQMATRSVETNFENWTSAQKQLEAAQAYYELISGAEKEGLINQLEFIDALNQLTQAGIFVNMQYQNYLSALAELERATASYPIQIN